MDVQKNIALASLTTLHVGGAAQFYTAIADESELQNACMWAEEHACTVTVLGGGSNVVVPDDGITGLVIKVCITDRSVEKLLDGSARIHVGAGELWDTFVQRVTQKGLWGLENLSGIPGFVGAAPIQNINAYGVSVSETIESVTACHVETGEKRNFTKEECAFGYRDSFFKTKEGKKYIVTYVTFLLSITKTVESTYQSASQSIEKYLKAKAVADPTVTDIREAVLSIRKNIGMLEGMYRSAGSFFKNVVISADEFIHIEKLISVRFAEKSEEFSPWYWKLPDGSVKIATAFLMECTQYNKTDFSGELFNGSVTLSPLHTLSIINKNNASANDIEAFGKHIQRILKDKFGVRVEFEVCFL